MENDRELSIAELRYILDKMNFYRRSSGYIADTPDGRMEFFDSKPSFGGAYVTKVVIERSLKNKLFNNEE